MVYQNLQDKKNPHEFFEAPKRFRCNDECISIEHNNKKKSHVREN